MTERQLPPRLRELMAYYGKTPSRAELAVEREVHGINAGIKSYTTPAQADRIVETDVTAEYRRTQAELCEANARHERAPRRVRGDEDFENGRRACTAFRASMQESFADRCSSRRNRTPRRPR